jgi:hypothetical protein
MSRLYPGHERRMRRLVFACILIALGQAMVIGAGLWYEIGDAPLWLYLSSLVGGVALGAVGVTLMVAYFRELRRVSHQ